MSGFEDLSRDSEGGKGAANQNNNVGMIPVGKLQQIHSADGNDHSTQYVKDVLPMPGFLWAALIENCEPNLLNINSE